MSPKISEDGGGRMVSRASERVGAKDAKGRVYFLSEPCMPVPLGSVVIHLKYAQLGHSIRAKVSLQGIISPRSIQIPISRVKNAALLGLSGSMRIYSPIAGISRRIGWVQCSIRR